MRIQATCLLVLAISTTFAAGQSVPGGLEYSPSVSSIALRYWYIGSFESIRKVDFANLYYYDGNGKTGALFQLRQGDVQVKYEIGGEEIHLDRVDYFRPSTTEPEAALVQLRWFSHGGSSSMDCLLLVFQIDEGSLVLTQELRFDLQAEGTGTDFDRASNTLTVRARSNDDTPHCCPKNIDVVTFAWTGKAFEEKTHRTIPIKK
jgi:hypothetical protein